MAKLSLSFSSIPDDSIPDGTYTGEIKSVVLKDSKSSSSQYLNWRIDIIGDEDGNPCDEAGRAVWLMTSLSERALFKLRDTFQALGLPEGTEEDMEVDDDSNALITPEVAGMIVIFTVKNEDYNGKSSPKVDSIVAVVQYEEEEA